MSLHEICSELGIIISESTSFGHTQRLTYNGISLGYINKDVIRNGGLFGYKFKFDRPKDGFNEKESVDYVNWITKKFGAIPYDWYWPLIPKNGKTYLFIKDENTARLILSIEVNEISGGKYD